MTTARRHDPEPRTSTIIDVGAALEREQAPDPKPAKPVNAMAEAVRLAAALAKIDKREHDALTNARARYDAEREELLAGASDKAKRILEAAAEEEGV